VDPLSPPKYLPSTMSWCDVGAALTQASAARGRVVVVAAYYDWVTRISSSSDRGRVAASGWEATQMTGLSNKPPVPLDHRARLVRSPRTECFEQMPGQLRRIPKRDELGPMNDVRCPQWADSDTVRSDLC
jgi:hypothetical protein